VLLVPLFARHITTPMMLVLLLCTGFVIPGAGQTKVSAPRTFVVYPQLDVSRRNLIAPVTNYSTRRPRVGLVLSGGGARGISQVGVLRVLEQQGIPIDFIAATSIGAIVGGLYASGYTTTELESLVVHTNWDELLSLGEETQRADLFVNQKQAEQRGGIILRFEGLEPILPSAVASGQRLTDYLSSLTFQALYHPDPSFDQLRVGFRAIATDLVSGKRVVLGDGSLAEALRASSTVPLLYTPIDRGGMQLVDGGLLSNIPVDVVLRNGCDMVIAVDATSALRTADEMKAPWEYADQIMGIMMGPANDRQLPLADVVITPELGRHLSSDFSGLDTLIARGELAARCAADTLRKIYERKCRVLRDDPAEDAQPVLSHPSIRAEGAPLPAGLLAQITRDTLGGSVSPARIQDWVDAANDCGDFREVHAELRCDSTTSAVVLFATSNPVVQSVRLEGCSALDTTAFRHICTGLEGKPLNPLLVREKQEELLRLYRSRGYSLARIDTTYLDPLTGVLHCFINEGVITEIRIEGGVRTKDEFILSEFPLAPGKVFEIGKAKLGLRNINSASIFDYVYLEATFPQKQTILTIRIKERPSQLIRLGLRGDNERHLQGLVDIRDINFRGGGGEVGLTIAGGQRNSDIVMEYMSHRLFNTYLTFRLGGFLRNIDHYLYDDDPHPAENRWSRVRVGEYRTSRYGATIAFGTQLERIGTATIEYTIQNVRTTSLDNAVGLEERYQLATLRFGTIVDSKDRYPFPTSGMGLDVGVEAALAPLGSNVSYKSLSAMYERYSTVGAFTIRPRVTMGFADRAMPFSQEFHLGGQDSFFGLRDDDRRGRQFLVLNLEFRYHLPFRVLFDAFIRTRFDMGSISSVPEEIKFNTLRYGAGLELALDTPLGPAVFSAGKGFYFGRNLPDNPIQEGPLLFYFMLGYQL
jgi:NTE family protein